MTAFVAFEGGEACGKSTQAARLAARLDAVLTREPGGTPVGEEVRRLLLDRATASLDGRAEALLLAADRAQHLAQIVEPALAAGRHVVTDRSAWSTIAYQGWGRGIDVGALRTLCDWATNGRWPDVVVLLDVPLGVASVRAGEEPDRFEAESGGFHERVAEGFRALAAEEPSFVVVDGVGGVDEVEARVWQAVEARIG